MSVYLLKSRFQSLLRPIVKRFYHWGMTANQITCVAAFLTITSAYLLWSSGPNLYWLAWPAILLIRMAMNAIDGMLAREHNQTSNLGFILNELCDLLSDGAVYISFLACSAFNPYLLISIVLFSWLSEFVAILALHITGQRANHGPMGKSDRALVFSLLAIWVAIGQPQYWLVSMIQWLLIALLFVTIYRRINTTL